LKRGLFGNTECEGTKVGKTCNSKTHNKGLPSKLTIFNAGDLLFGNIFIYFAKFSTNMKKAVFYVSLLVMIAGMVAAEEPASAHHNVKLTFNVGTTTYFADSEKPDPVREFNSATDANCGFAPLSLTVHRSFFSSTVDYYVYRNKLGLSAGVIVSSLETLYEPNGSYFYWNYASNGTTTDFLRISNFTQTSYYAGIPLEAKYFFRSTERAVNFYVKLGCSINFRLGCNNDVAFYSEAMEKYRDEVLRWAPTANSIFSNVYSAVGLKFGRFKETAKSFPQINVEFRPFDLVLSRNFALFVANPQVTDGVGIQLSVQFPLNHNVRIGTR